MHIVITGVTGFRNRGVEALVRPIVQQMAQRLPGLRQTILTDSPDYDAERIADENVSVLRDVFLEQRGARSAHLRARSMRFLRSLRPSYRRQCDLISNASLVIATGGDVFSSDYGSLEPLLAPLVVASRAGVPFVFLAQSIGPFKTEAEVDDFRTVARHAALITVREQYSYDYVVSKIGISRDRVRLTADPAFLLEPSSPSMAQATMRFYRLDALRPTVALGVSRGIEKFSQCDAVAHKRAWVRVVQMLFDELGANVLLVPHVEERTISHDDRNVATRLVRELGFPEHLALTSLEHTAAEFKGLISQCQLVISERMHAAIAGLSTKTPTIAVGYSVKSGGIIETLFDDEIERKHLVVPLDEFLSSDRLCDAIRWVWENRQRVSAQLDRRLPEIQRRASENFDLMASLVKKGHQG